MEASNYIPQDAKINKMDGFKIICEDIEADVWTGKMEDFLASNYFKYVYNSKTGVRIARV